MVESESHPAVGPHARPVETLRGREPCQLGFANRPKEQIEHAFVVHYHVDWCKEMVLKRYGWAPDTAAFWHAMGIDQLAHGLTYVAIVWALIAF